MDHRTRKQEHNEKKWSKSTPAHPHSNKIWCQNGSHTPIWSANAKDNHGFYIGLKQKYHQLFWLMVISYANNVIWSVALATIDEHTMHATSSEALTRQEASFVTK